MHHTKSSHTKSSSSSQKRKNEKVQKQVDYDRLIEEDPSSKAIFDTLVDILTTNFDPDIKGEHLKAIVSKVKGKQDIVYIRAYLRSCLKNIKADFAIKQKYMPNKENKADNRRRKDFSDEEWNQLSDFDKLKYISVIDEYDY